MPTVTRFYLTPKIGTGVAGDPFRPEHFIDGEGLTWIAGGVVCQDYGQEPSYFVTTVITDEEHAQVIAQPGVTEVPGPAPTLDYPIGACAYALGARLEADGFPGTWITPHTSARNVLRHLQRCVVLAQRLQPYGRLFPDGRTLDSTVGDLTPAQRQLLVNAVGEAALCLPDVWTLRTAITHVTAALPFPSHLLDVGL
jgi:hypothetical protein